MKYLFSLLLFFCLSFHSIAQSGHWSAASETNITDRSKLERRTSPTKYHFLSLDVNSLRRELAKSPNDRTNEISQIYVDLPGPDGSFKTFKMTQYDIMESELAAKYPFIRAYSGKDVETGMLAYVNFTNDQFFGVVRDGNSNYYIDPYAKNDNDHYIVYKSADLERNDLPQMECQLVENDIQETISEIQQVDRGDAVSLLTYRAAIVTTQGFTDYHGGTVADGLGAVVTILNRINSVYEVDVAIRMVLVNNNDLLIYTTDDGYDQGDLGSMINRNQSIIDSKIGQGSYDIGHVFGNTGYQGLAQLGAVCSSSKARGASILNNPEGDRFAINLISHEMGHQFNATHTMYHCHNVTLSTAYEPGSGSTIMSYTGICSSIANIQSNSDPYFHINSAERIQLFSRGGASCRQEIDNGNTDPDISFEYPTTIHIPINTPFKLEGTATDAEDADLTYNWEQYQAGFREYADPNTGQPTFDINSPMGNEPTFRSVPPTAESFRYFPALSGILASSNYRFEKLPTYERDLTFRLTVRDNHLNGGGMNYKTQKIKSVDNTADGVFDITNFNLRDTIYYGGYEELTWDVAGTDKGPINCEFVNIYFSNDRGASFPYLLLENTPNDGSAFVNIPVEPGDRARFMVKAVNNVFLQVNNRSVNMEEFTTPTIGLKVSSAASRVCAPDIIRIPIETYGLGGLTDTIELEYTGDEPAGSIIRFSRSKVLPGQQVDLVLNFLDIAYSGQLDLSFVARSIGAADENRAIESTVIANNYTNMTLDEPLNGSSGNSEAPVFRWTEVSDADKYNFEISTDPNFNTIVLRKPNITTGFANLNNQLEPGTVYYWRVLPVNDCGETNANKISSFQTRSLSCTEYASTSGPLNISASGTPEVSMEINTGSSIDVTEINVTSIKGSHQEYGDLTMTLEGPSGKKVVLFNQSCGFQGGILDLGFDDEAATTIRCNRLKNGDSFKPSGDLIDLSGETGSVYNLIVKDNSPQYGGELTSWAFEICGAVAQTNPEIVRADSMHVQRNAERTVSSAYVEVSHSIYSSAELTLTILEIPTFGSMLLNGTPISTGATLTMADIEAGNLSYKNNGTYFPRDHFSFIVTDPGGGFIGTPRIDFSILGTMVANTDLELSEAELIVFPNPASDRIQVKLSDENLFIDQITIYNLHGKQMLNFVTPKGNEATMDVSMLIDGLYLIQVRSGKYVSVRKVAIH